LLLIILSVNHQGTVSPIPYSMRIALFTETFLPKVDGIVTRLRHTIEHLQRNGDEVLIFCPAGGLDSYQGGKIYGLSAFPLPLYPELKLAFPRPEIGQQLAKFKPDLIHVINPAVLGLAGIFYAKTYQIPLVASYHTHLPKYLQHYGLGWLEGLLWELLKGAHNQAELNLCTSSAMVAELRQRGIDRVDLWQRGVDTKIFHPDRSTTEMRHYLSQGAPASRLLLYVGRLGAEKEIEQIKPILAAIPGARLAIVGNGPHRAYLENYFVDTPTHFVGYLEGVKLASAYAAADAFIFPSRTETLGLVLLEAMAAGCPPIAARSGGIPDIVTDGKNGYLFDPQDPQGAIVATQKLFAEPASHQLIRNNARAEAERWGWLAATRQLQQYYRQVVDRQLKWDK
jgi:glycosyltransferase involved in cell wall biosynthesis